MSDTAAFTRQLQAALAPTTGLQRIPITLESYMDPSSPLALKRLVNLYAEEKPNDARTRVALVSTPGLEVHLTVGPGPITAMNSDMPGRLYLISGDHAYRLWYPDPDLGGSTVLVQDLGYVGVPGPDAAGGDSLFSTIAVGVTGVVFCVPPNSFASNHEDALLQITDPDYPGATSVAHLDGYYCFTNVDDSAGWFFSQLLDPTNISALDFAFADAMPNIVRRVIAHRGQLWFCGESVIEVWYNAGVNPLGGSPFPFRRIEGGVIYKGVLNAETVATGDGSVWFVGHDFVVYRTRGYQLERVSTHSIEDWLRKHGLVGQRRSALTWSALGHTFYAFTSADRTMIYDAATRVWADRTSAVSVDESLGIVPWRPRTVASASPLLLFGDSLTGKLFQIVPGSPLEDGVEVVRHAVMPPLGAWIKRGGAGQRMFCSRVEIEMEVGTQYAPRFVLLEWSNDGGYTWTGSRVMSVGMLNDVTKRVFATRLGSFRQRMFRVTMHGAPAIYTFDADISAGTT